MVQYKNACALRFSCVLGETQVFEPIDINLEPLIPASLLARWRLATLNWDYNVLHIIRRRQTIFLHSRFAKQNGGQKAQCRSTRTFTLNSCSCQCILVGACLPLPDAAHV